MASEWKEREKKGERPFRVLTPDPRNGRGGEQVEQDLEVGAQLTPTILPL